MSQMYYAIEKLKLNPYIAILEPFQLSKLSIYSLYIKKLFIWKWKCLKMSNVCFFYSVMIIFMLKHIKS